MAYVSNNPCPFIVLTEGSRDLETVVVDLGYSARRRSCGLYWTGADQPVELAFGDAIRETAEVVRRLNKPLLVIEAVLSTFHAESGNPDVRGDFERGRGWYYGAGVLSFAGALRFLRVLNRELNTKGLPLAEAFLSNKDTTTGHGEDAVLIHNRFWATEPVVLRPGVEPASPLVRGIPPVRVFALEEQEEASSGR